MIKREKRARALDLFQALRVEKHERFVSKAGGAG